MLHLVAQALEHRFGDFAKLFFVVHEQHAARAVTQGGGFAHTGFKGLFGDGQKGGERGPDAHRGIDPELTAVFTNDGKHGGEAETGASFFGRKEGLEYAVDFVVGDTGTVVLHLDLHVVASAEARESVRGQGDGAAGDVDATLGRVGHGLHGVDDEVLEYLNHLAAVDFDGAGGFVGIECHDDGAAGGGDPDGVAKNIGRTGDREGAAGISLGEGEELAREGFGRHAGGFGVAQFVVIAIVFGDGDGAEDGGERIVEIVGNATGELTQGVEAIGADEFLGAERHLLRVAEDDDETDHLLLIISELAGGPDDGPGRSGVGIERVLG